MEVEWQIQSNALSESLTKLARHLEDEQDWLIGGSCSLWLQGVQVHQPPRDIDIYMDEQDIGNVHNKLNYMALDTPRLDTSGIYKSILSHYEIGNYTAELVGGFEVRSGGSHYCVNIRGLLKQEAPTLQMNGHHLYLMPLAHEYVFNLLRDRPDRYVPIAEVLKNNANKHRALLLEILQSNRWSKAHRASILDVIG
ncbi:hypothetical protein J2Z69_000546 [Paenibacillus shirakamiensis]|uniref:Uncharacterized protein n=1 Tax=Paenibacillus shirakamiensis TaxID=1265935 RepID=A0ABS4JCR9_9BACL|nr:hypothetical protein [Paenibacillus shirakamiensis]MBP1999527.1 hypothetical protein [Paenibacillus shirakamiensis]